MASSRIAGSRSLVLQKAGKALDPAEIASSKEQWSHPAEAQSTQDRRMLFVVIGNLLVMGCNTRIIPYAAKKQNSSGWLTERPEAAELLCFAIYNRPDLCRSKDPAIMIIIAYLREFSVTISPEYMCLPVGAVFCGSRYSCCGRSVSYTHLDSACRKEFNDSCKSFLNAPSRSVAINCRISSWFSVILIWATVSSSSRFMVLWLLSLCLKDEPVAYLFYTHYTNKMCIRDRDTFVCIWCDHFHTG